MSPTLPDKPKVLTSGEVLLQQVHKERYGLKQVTPKKRVSYWKWISNGANK
jgi:hypothetical protein